MTLDNKGNNREIEYVVRVLHIINKNRSKCYFTYISAATNLNSKKLKPLLSDLIGKGYIINIMPDITNASNVTPFRLFDITDKGISLLNKLETLYSMIEIKNN